MQDPRAAAAAKYQNGNRYSERNKAEDLDLSIRYYLDALSAFTDIPEKEITPKDAQDMQAVLASLLKTMNRLIVFSLDTPQFSDWIFVLNTLENFLRSYVTYVRVFNKVHQRLQGLDALDRNLIVALYKRKELSEPQKQCVEIYMAVISLFQHDMVSEENLSCASQDSSVVKAFDLYRRALKAPRELPASVEEKAPPAAQVSSPPQFTPLPASSSPRSTQSPSSSKRVVKFFDQFASDPQKRAKIAELMVNGLYDEALKIHPHIVNCISADYRAASECQRQLGDRHFDQDKLLSALECYREALFLYRHIRFKDVQEEKDVQEADRRCIQHRMSDFMQALNELMHTWSQNFSEACNGMVIFLTFYLNNIEFLQCGLDALQFDPLVEFLGSAREEGLKKITEHYLTIIAMFRQGALLPGDQLNDKIAQFKREKNANIVSITASDLFKKALEIVEQGHHKLFVNPELAIAAEREQKRQRMEHKRLWQESSESSSPPFLPAFGLAQAPEPLPPLPPEASSQSNSLAKSN